LAHERGGRGSRRDLGVLAAALASPTGACPRTGIEGAVVIEGKRTPMSSTHTVLWLSLAGGLVACSPGPRQYVDPGAKTRAEVTHAVAVVHPTAGGNDYSRAEAASVVKAIQLYHVRGNGWNDIGYNFLVDRFGTIYEGRFGGTERNVVGAHALGFNSGSVGIALLGTYGSTAPSRAAQDALARLVAWRLDLAHVDPTAFTTVISAGSEKYASGLPVLLRSVSGHRDTGYTECPGNLLFARLNDLARAANAIGLPKVYEPRADATGRLVRIRARLSSGLAWTTSVVSAFAFAHS